MVAQIDQTTRSFYRVPKFVVHKGGEIQEIDRKTLGKMPCKPTSAVGRSRMGKWLCV